MRRAAGPMTADKVTRAAVTHGLFVVAAALVAHVFLAYFVSLPGLYQLVRTGPRAHPEAFAWMLGTTALFYVNFGVFREQFCVVVCPYGRLQSVLLDDDSLVVGYDERRGEPRSKGRTRLPGKGDCVECQRCVAVCPTGIDIRDGLQLDCIACTACMDACDEVMTKLGRERGLIRYDSLRGLRGEPRRVLRPRVFLYAVLLVVGVAASGLALRKREVFEANILRLPGAPYTREDGALRNGFELHLVNKESTVATFEITAPEGTGLAFVVPTPRIEIEPLGSRRVPVFVTMPEGEFSADQPFSLRVRVRAVSGARGERDASSVFLGAKR
jgi:cytochrome c oxidase accessory protein FixG